MLHNTEMNTEQRHAQRVSYDFMQDTDSACNKKDFSDTQTAIVIVIHLQGMSQQNH